MSRPKPRWRGRLVLGASAALAILAGPAAAGAMADPGALYTQTNDPAGNVVQKFDRNARGELEPAGTFSTGGIGLATLGGRQGAVELSDDESTVYAVNAGSNTVSVLRVTESGLALEDVVASGGTAPASVDERDGRVWVLNSGGMPNVTAFRASDRSLSPIAGGSRNLPGAVGAAQVTASPDGERLVVTERLSNRLDTLALDEAGRPGAPVVIPSDGVVPFGFAFGHRGDVIVSEAGSASISSYRVDADGALSAITAALPVGFGAPCWVAVSPNGKLAYTGNASGSISGFGVAPDGSLEPIGTTLVASPRDLDFSRNGRFLYAVSPGNAATGGRVTGYRVTSDGSLEQVTSVPAAAGLTGAAAS